MKKAGPPRQVGRGAKRAAGNATRSATTGATASRKGTGSSTAQKTIAGKKKVPTGTEKTEVQKKPVWTKKDEMARKIQTYYRGYCCRKLLRDMKQKKADYDAMMDKLQKEAYVQMVRMEQQRAEAERKREEEERRKQREQARRRTRMLEAAFDGDTVEINAVLTEVEHLCKEKDEDTALRNRHMLVECTDANGNTPLSEAAAGGDPNTIRLLISLEANPNRKGQYGRTPLYRAAFAGHIQAVKILLESGADPRITSNDGERPDQVASSPEIEDVFKEWSLEETDRLLKQLDEAEHKRREKQNKLFETIESKLKKLADDAEKEYSVKQRELLKAHEELNKRIFEHDRNMASEAVKTDITLAIVHDAEDLLQSARLAAEEARKKLNDARLQLRLKRKEFKSDEEEKLEDSSDDFADVTINIRELDDVLMKDVGNKILDSGKWPLILDPGKQAATFLRYRDTNYINCCNPRHMETETLRLALLGAIRYGKFFVLDLLDIDGLWRGVEQRMNLVQKNVLEDLMTLNFIKESKYLSLCRESDGEEYSPKAFLGARVHDFKMVVVTQLDSLPREFTEQFYVISVQALRTQ